MISHIDITGSKVDVDASLKQYIFKKIGRLDKYLPRRARKSVKAEVILRFVNRTHGNKYECEVLLHVPDSQITAKDSTLNMFAAVDIVEEKLKNQLRKYKDKHTVALRGRQHGILRRIKAQLARSQAL
ncbi:MAG TPA: ribosome-associated translation inhibitor RaiA [Candidatus Saccharimonadales bacterium]|jgi:putative sigma-54 modulation protein|nr:ribosome-associated translation inhibitor RaiA [Candidatus Saccharimonadales bacterium]